MSSPLPGLNVLLLRNSSQVQSVPLLGLIDRCPTIPADLHRRWWRVCVEAPAWAADLAWLINSIHCSQAVCDRCSGPNLCPSPLNLNPASFIGPAAFLPPHPFFLLGVIEEKLRSPLAQMKCLRLISWGCFYQPGRNPSTVHLVLGNTWQICGLPCEIRQNLWFHRFGPKPWTGHTSWLAATSWVCSSLQRCKDRLTTPL